MCADRDWHCQHAFRQLGCYSPHKRRAEIAERGKYFFEERPCVHGVRGQKDYRMGEIVYAVSVFPPSRSPESVIESKKQAIL